MLNKLDISSMTIKYGDPLSLINADGGLINSSKEELCPIVSCKLMNKGCVDTYTSNDVMISSSSPYLISFGSSNEKLG